MKQHVISALVSAVVSVAVCLAFSMTRHNLPVRWQYDSARAEKKRRDAEEKERQRAAAEFARTNKAVMLTNVYGSVYFRDDTGAAYGVITLTAWDHYFPTFNETDIELGFRLDGVVLFRTPPEAPRPKLTNDVPIL